MALYNRTKQVTMKQTKLFITVLLALLLSVSGSVRAQSWSRGHIPADVPEEERQELLFVCGFYISYMKMLISNEKNSEISCEGLRNALLKEALTRKALENFKLKQRELDYDPLLKARKCSLPDVKTVMVSPKGNCCYEATYFNHEAGEQKTVLMKIRKKKKGSRFEIIDLKED